MTVEEYKEKLKELHEKIKENPFRRNYEVNAKYGKGYYDLVYKFAETFYHLTKDIQKNRIEKDVSENDRKLEKVADTCLFIHDFYGAVNRSENAILSNKIEILHEEEELIELDISCVHCYIESGFFNRFPFRYKGSIVWAEWNDEKDDYVIDFG